MAEALSQTTQWEPCTHLTALMFEYSFISQWWIWIFIYQSVVDLQQWHHIIWQNKYSNVVKIGLHAHLLNLIYYIIIIIIINRPFLATIMCCEFFTDAFFLLETVPVEFRLFLVKTDQSRYYLTISCNKNASLTECNWKKLTELLAIQLCTYQQSDWLFRANNVHETLENTCS